VIRVALLGAGYVQDFHALAVREHPDAELVAVANWREPSARELAERFDIPRVTTDWQELAGSGDVDAAVVGTPNALHAPQAVAFLEAGKHVMVEKPMAISVHECDRMIEASRASGAFLMVAHCWRFRDEVRAMRERIVAGELGQIVRTHGYGLHEKWGPGGWFIDPARSGGGALVDMGVHAIDTARFLLGDPVPTRVCASIGTRYGGYPVDDDGVLLITWSNGVSSVVESGWWQPHIGGLEADTEVFGTGGYARIWDPEPPSEDYKHDTQPMYSTQMGEFLGAIAEGRQPRPSGEDGRVVMEVVEEAYRSAEASAPDPAP
jgi:predicted dehydrogenase